MFAHLHPRPSRYVPSPSLPSPPHPQSDLSTFANNLVGVVLGGMQLGLIWAYPSKRGAVTDVGAEKKHEHGTEGSSSGGSSVGSSGAVSPIVSGLQGNGSAATDRSSSSSGRGAVGGDNKSGNLDDDEDVSESAPLAR